MDKEAELPPGGIGGFMGRETPMAVSRPLFPDAVRFSTGRAALARVLRRLDAKILFHPDWMCDSVLDTARSLGCAPVPYLLDNELLPLRPPRPGPGEALLLLDPFGLAGSRLQDFVALAPTRTIVDLTQAMYATRPTEAWAFASARKFIGVADGAFLWGPDPGPPPLPSPPRKSSHLDARADGRPDAHAQYLAHERSLTAEELGPCPATEWLLDNLDHTRLANIRASNFKLVHEALGDTNQLPLPDPLPPELAPVAYPYLPKEGVTHEALARHRVWVPRLWPERRADPQCSPLALRLAERLLPLPIDHRYGPNEMSYITDVVLKLQP